MRRGETGLTGNVYAGLHEFEDMAFLLHFLRADDLFVDVGANAGSYSILAGAAVGTRVIAFEPVLATFKRLVANVRLNEAEGRVRCINAGVGAARDCIAFSSRADTQNHALAPGETCDHPVTVDVAPLDEYLAGQVPSLLKIDVEGYETNVLEGARETLGAAALRAVIVELNGSARRYGLDDRGVSATLRARGFVACAYDPFARTHRRLEGERRVGGNTLFLRDESFVMSRVQSAPPVRLPGRRS